MGDANESIARKDIADEIEPLVELCQELNAEPVSKECSSTLKYLFDKPPERIRQVQLESLMDRVRKNTWQLIECCEDDHGVLASRFGEIETEASEDLECNEDCEVITIFAEGDDLIVAVTTTRELSAVCAIADDSQNQLSYDPVIIELNHQAVTKSVDFSMHSSALAGAAAGPSWESHVAPLNRYEGVIAMDSLFRSGGQLDESWAKKRENNSLQISITSDSTVVNLVSSWS